VTLIAPLIQRVRMMDAPVFLPILMLSYATPMRRKAGARSSISATMMDGTFDGRFAIAIV